MSVPALSFSGALRRHWPEYLIEAALLGAFMVSACVVTALLEHPASPLRHAVPSDVVRRALIGLGMGLTATGLIYSPWGRRSGAHFNPSVTLTFLRLGKVEPWDAAFYVGAQFLGGVLGVMLSAVLLGSAIADPAVRYVVTVPGSAGAGVAFAAELTISFLLMSVVLRSSNTASLARFTGLFAGLLVATYITLEAPLSGMSMNPARTLGSAVVGRLWTSLWVYFTAPLAGMLLAAEVHRRRRRRVLCAKLDHPATGPCIFRCGYGAQQPAGL
jgi:aquaporin Z